MTSIVGAALGFVLFMTIIVLNWGDLIDAGATLQRAPLGLAVSIAVHVPQIVLDSVAWRTLLPRSIRPRVRTMVLLRWIRESLNALMPAGAIVGQAIAAHKLTRDGVPNDLAGATATVDMTVEAAAQAIFTFLGLLLILVSHPDLHLARLALIGIAAAAAVAVAAIAAQRNLPIRLIEMTWARLLGRWLQLKSGWVSDFQTSVLRLHADRPSLVRAACLHLAAWGLGAVEIAGNAALLGHPISIGDGLIVESLTQALRSAAFMIPGALGFQEGAIVAACGLVGVPPTIALTLALLRRARELLISIPGLWTWRRFGRALRVKSPMEQTVSSAVAATLPLKKS